MKEKQKAVSGMGSGQSAGNWIHSPSFCSLWPPKSAMEAKTPMSKAHVQYKSGHNKRPAFYSC